MRSFETIGFSDVESLDQEEKIVRLLSRNAGVKKSIQVNSKVIKSEMFSEVCKDTGLVIRGEYIDDTEVNISHYFPAHISRVVSMKEKVMFNKRMDTDAYTGMCDDYRLGITMIFYLQNKAEMMASGYHIDEERECTICLTGMAESGKILLPVEGAFVPEKVQVTTDNKSNFEERKDNEKNNFEAISIDEIEKYAIMNKRVQNEDVYSIVNTTLLPCGTESDFYSVLGYIKNVELVENRYTKEQMYIMLITCNDMDFEICINKNHLIGEPLPGRRFKGDIWMQGCVDFYNK